MISWKESSMCYLNQSNNNSSNIGIKDNNNDNNNKKIINYGNNYSPKSIC